MNERPDEGEYGDRLYGGGHQKVLRCGSVISLLSIGCGNSWKYMRNTLGWRYAGMVRAGVIWRNACLGG